MVDVATISCVGGSINPVVIKCSEGRIDCGGIGTFIYCRIWDMATKRITR